MGGRGGPPNSFLIGIILFMLLGSPPKFGTLSVIYLKIAYFPVKIGLFGGIEKIIDLTYNYIMDLRGI